MTAARAASAPATGEAEAAELFRQGEELVIAGRPGDAVAKFRTVVNRCRESSVAPQAQFRIAQLFDRNRENEKAFENYQILIDHFPASDLYAKAVEAQHRIADRVVEAYALRDRKGEDRAAAPLGDRERASRMLRILLENGRHAAWAPETRFRLAVALEKEGWRRSAIEEHEMLLENHPGHHLADDAAFQVGYINYKFCKERNDESNYRTRAQLAFHYFLQAFPESEKRPRALHLLAELDSLEFNALVAVGEYYEKKGDPRAALVYYGDAEQRFPSHFTRLEWLPVRLKELRAENPEAPAERKGPEAPAEKIEADARDPVSPASGR